MKTVEAPGMKSTQVDARESVSFDRSALPSSSRLSGAVYPSLVAINTAWVHQSPPQGEFNASRTAGRLRELVKRSACVWRLLPHSRGTVSGRFRPPPADRPQPCKRGLGDSSCTDENLRHPT
jgi:hypothetical protein